MKYGTSSAYLEDKEMNEVQVEYAGPADLKDLIQSIKNKGQRILSVCPNKWQYVKKNYVVVEFLILFQ